MRPVESIAESVKKLRYKASTEARDRVLVNVLHALEESQKQKSAEIQPNLWRIVMKSGMTKLAAAAVIVLGVYLGLHSLGGPDMAKRAWADVTSRVAQVEHVHYYVLDCRQDGVEGTLEGWYSDGKEVRRMMSDGYMWYDDGQACQAFDRHNVRTVKRKSRFAGGKGFFDVITSGFLSQQNEQFNKQVPDEVGDDFLIYRFASKGLPEDEYRIMYVTVGRNSLLPIQIKIYWMDPEATSDEGQSLVVFDYAAPTKPAEFFVPPADTKAPHGTGEVVLGGQEVAIDIHGVPGIRQAIVRLRDKYEGPSDQIPIPRRDKYEEKGEPIYMLDVTFITDEGFRSPTLDGIVMWLNEGSKCGCGANNWPDGKYRNIRSTPVLRPTDREDVFVVEISCWVRTKPSFF
jgi:hypothetical protein